MTGADLRRLALALPEVTEQVTWEVDLTFRVRNKIFAIMGEAGDEASIKATRDAQAALVGSDPVTYRVSAYTGRFGWTTVVLGRVDEAELAELLEDAWRRTAPKRLVTAYDAGR
jgi:hypothetical protein